MACVLFAKRIENTFSVFDLYLFSFLFERLSSRGINQGSMIPCQGALTTGREKLMAPRAEFIIEDLKLEAYFREWLKAHLTISKHCIEGNGLVLMSQKSISWINSWHIYAYPSWWVNLVGDPQNSCISLNFTNFLYHGLGYVGNLWVQRVWWGKSHFELQIQKGFAKIIKTTSFVWCGILKFLCIFISLSTMTVTLTIPLWGSYWCFVEANCAKQPYQLLWYWAQFISRSTLFA